MGVWPRETQGRVIVPTPLQLLRPESFNSSGRYRVEIKLGGQRDPAQDRWSH